MRVILSKRYRTLIYFSVLSFSLTSAALASAASLINAPGVELVRGHCSACHSLNLVTAQRGDRAFWLKTIRWMQAEQNLWQLPQDHERTILDYLVEHYAEKEWGRRPQLPVHLRPGSTLRK